MNPPRQKKRTGSRVRTGETNESKRIEKDKLKTNKHRKLYFQNKRGIYRNVKHNKSYRFLKEIETEKFKHE